MDMKKNFLTAAAVGLVALGGASVADNAEAAGGKEKCYGVVKAGANDCASASGSHSCVGYATKDASGEEFVVVPSGLCERLAGGSTTPKS